MRYHVKSYGTRLNGRYGCTGEIHGLTATNVVSPYRFANLKSRESFTVFDVHGTQLGSAYRADDGKLLCDGCLTPCPQCQQPLLGCPGHPGPTAAAVTPQPQT